MAKKFECDEGFMVQGENEDEIMSMAAMHIFMMHPKEKVSMEEMKHKIMKV